MSNQIIRQTELFAGGDWQVLYKAFTQINFNACDPATINQALRDYIRNNYPEEFNDWIETDEFVAIIDLLSYLAGSLAFRTDVNARENFLETAQARESVLRLARFLSYNPRRAQSARGLVKITDVKTTASIVDSFGVNLNNRFIKWNDPDNVDWLEQFTLVMNAAFAQTNPFGIPLKNGKTASIPTQLYRLNSTTNAQCAYKFSATVDGDSTPFEIVNVDFVDGEGFNERAPVPTNPFHLIYRNDGKGNSSNRTGFFMFFKQGSLSQQTYDISIPVENRVVDVDTNNISETDVWFQSLGDQGQIVSQWTKVPGVFNENITYNSLAPDLRDIFSVVTRDNDRISLRFGDGRFGNVPLGTTRTWFRTVTGKQYTIRPRDMENITIAIPYYDGLGRTQTLTVKFSLLESCTNAVSSEDIEQVRRRAPQVFGTQNRMVSGEDYNVFPLSSNEIVKLRSVNRVYSGHSRFLDINDPTATYQDTTVLSDDGVVYRENIKQFVQVSSNSILTPEEIVNQKMVPLLSAVSLRDAMNEKFLLDGDFAFNSGDFIWESTGSGSFSSSGKFVTARLTNDPTNIRLENILTTGTKMKFSWGSDQSVWAMVVNEPSATPSGGNQVFNMVVDQTIPEGANLVKAVPAFRSTVDARPFSDLEVAANTSEFESIYSFVNAHNPFKLFYNFKRRSELQYGGAKLAGQWVAVPSTATDLDPTTYVKVMTCDFKGGGFWAVTVLEGVRYIFESTKDVRFHNINQNKVVDNQSGIAKKDKITLLWAAEQIVNGSVVKRNVEFEIVNNVFDPDGYPVTSKVVISPVDSDSDGIVDDPESFVNLINLPYQYTPTGWVRPGTDVAILDGDASSPYNTLIPVPAYPVFLGTPSPTDLVDGVFYQLGEGFKKMVDGSAVDLDPVDDAAVIASLPNVLPGVMNLKFQWKHFASTDARIDPAITNIIDTFVLTSEYDYLVRLWIKNGAKVDDMPEPPSDVELSTTFASFEQYKMFSDQIIWRPVKYKMLFGSSAISELQAQIKIVRLPNPTLSDGEIRSAVIQTINDYFDVNRWEFGETFYFTELAAYIHLQLATSISSVALVPRSENGKFGQLFEVRCNTDEVFISTAQVDDVLIIDSNSSSNLRIS